MNIYLVQKKEYLEVIVTGQYDHQEAVKRFPMVINACQLAGVKKALVDFRKLEGAIAATSKVLYAMQIKEYYSNHIHSGGDPLKIAYVGSPSIIGFYEPGSEVAQREKLPTILTSDKDKALLWLGVNAPNKSS
jgi:hypothetical protein